MKTIFQKILNRHKNMIAVTPPSDCFKDNNELLMDIIAAAGFSNIEIPCDVSDVKSFAKAAYRKKVKITSVHGSLGYDAVSLSERKRIIEVKREMKRMRELKHCAPCPYVVHYLDRFNDKKRTVAYRKSIEELLNIAGEFGFILAVETVPYKPEEDERYVKTKELVAFVKSFNSQNIGICVDVNHSNLNENLKDVIDNCKGFTVNVHVSDNRGLREEHLPPGYGVIKFEVLLAALFGSGYRGFFTLEINTLKVIEASFCESRVFLENMICKTGQYEGLK